MMYLRRLIWYLAATWRKVVMWLAILFVSTWCWVLAHRFLHWMD